MIIELDLEGAPTCELSGCPVGTVLELPLAPAESSDAGRHRLQGDDVSGRDCAVGASPLDIQSFVYLDVCHSPVGSRTAQGAVHAYLWVTYEDVQAREVVEVIHQCLDAVGNRNRVGC